MARSHPHSARSHPLSLCSAHHNLLFLLASFPRHFSIFLFQFFPSSSSLSFSLDYSPPHPFDCSFSQKVLFSLLLILMQLVYCVGNFSPTYGGQEPSRHRVVVPARQPMYSLATQFQTQILELIPRPIAGLKFSSL